MSEKIEDLWGLTDEERLLCAQARAEGRADALREAARITRRERDDFVEARAQGLPLLRAEAILGPLADHLDQLAASALRPPTQADAGAVS